MRPHLAVIEPGLATTVQDFGRTGHQRFGIPVSGALDRIALAGANTVVGNAGSEAALECLYRGPTFEVRADSARVVVAGAGATLAIEQSGRDRRVPSFESIFVERGAHLRVEIAGPGTSAYLAVEGGIDVPAVLGSRATYTRGRFGGLEGRALRPGDAMPLRKNSAPPHEELRLPGLTLAPASTVRVVLGPQDDHFTPTAIRTLLGAVFSITPASDRMGLRLSGPRLEHAGDFNIISDAIPPGAIQVPGDGQPIILLADRQTTGGYAKIATVISADLPSLGRVGAGARLRFAAIGIREAESLACALQAEIANWRHRLERIANPADTGALLGQNLISGVTDAQSQDPIGPPELGND